MNFSDLVRTDEMEDAQLWLREVLEGVGATAAPKPEVELRRLRQPGFSGTYYKGLSSNGRPISMCGKIYPTGLGMEAGSSILITLPGPARRLTCLVGAQDTTDSDRAARELSFSIQIRAGETLWRSEPLTAASCPAPLDMALDGKTEFVLNVEGPPNDANWADVRVELHDGTTIPIGSPRKQGACFHFLYGSTSSAVLLHDWLLEVVEFPTDNGVTLHRVIRTDPITGLQVIVDIKSYEKHPVVEWTMRFRNTSSIETPIIRNIRSMEVILPADRGYILIDTTHGDPARPQSYQPCRHAIGSLYAGQYEAKYDEYSFAPANGRSTDGAWPYYNIQFPSMQRGVIAAIGWPGQWCSHFSRDPETLRIAAGQELTHFKLLPGEEVRTPLSVLMFWRGGDSVRSQNMWRRWMMDCNIPRPGGALPPPIMSGTSWPFTNCMVDSDEESQNGLIDLHVSNNLPIDHWWMDAGWYRANRHEGWVPTGTWEVNTEKFPNGIRAICDHAHANDIKSILWFEPERVAPGTWLAENRPEWLLGSQHTKWKLFDLGNPRARQWLTDHIDKMIGDEAVDVYRQDFNMEPLSYWRENDEPDRQGITELHYVEGLLAYWDELLRRHPHLLIDECAAGGRRNDLEMMRRSVPLHRTDFEYGNQASKQAMTYGLSSWLPYSGSNVLPIDRVDAYAFRSGLSPGTSIGFDVRRKDLDYDLLRKLMLEHKRISPCFQGDFYPLTACSHSEKDWIAWQFDRPDLGEGMVQIFRRSASPFVTATFPLHALAAEAVYAVEDLDAPGTRRELPGKSLMEEGLAATLPVAPQAVIFTYRRKPAQ